MSEVAKIIESIRDRMANGEFYCFGNPVGCSDAIDEFPRCPLLCACLEWFKQLLMEGADSNVS
jgi:hypothetical protein